MSFRTLLHSASALLSWCFKSYRAHVIPKDYNKMRGSIRKRSAHSWTITYDLPKLEAGRRRQRTETIHGTRRDAEKRLAERLNEVDRRVIYDGSKKLFKDVAESFLDERSRRISATTLGLYSRNLRVHIFPVLGEFRVGEIRREHVEEVLRTARDHSRTRRRGSSIGCQTLRNILIVLKMCLQHGVNNDWLGRNVASSVAPPAERHLKEPICYDPAQVAAILKAVRGTEIERETIFALATGVRRGELCALRWRDVDLESQQFSVARSAANLGSQVVYKVPKTKRSLRTEALPQFLVPQLKGWRALCSSANIGSPDAEFVFHPGCAPSWNPNELSRKFSRLVRRVKLKPLRFHDLRHMHASMAFEAGVPPRVISESLGHSSLAITSDTYVHLTNEGKRRKAQSIDCILREEV